jgi:hypothetical protein
MSNPTLVKKNNIFGGVFSDSEDEKEILDDSLKDEILFRVQERHDVIKKYREFLSNPEFITNKGDPNTNIVDRYSMVGDTICSMMYNIPEDKISKFFKYIEYCRRQKLKMMVYEKQEEYSGFMIDFDIYQDKDESFITNAITYALTIDLLRFLNKYVDLSAAIPETGLDHTEIYVAYIKKPKVLYNSEKKCFKDGFHILIPSLKLSRETKKFLLEQCIENDIFKNVFRNVPPTKGYTHKDFIDMNSAHVPCHFLGSSTKMGSPPYYLQVLYKSKLFHDDGDNITPLVDRCDDLIKDDPMSPIVLCHELSLNWETEAGVVKKRKYELKESYLPRLSEMREASADLESAVESENGELSLLKLHDPDADYIMGLLDTLSPDRSYNFNEWFSVMCVLAHTSKSYKPLADHFSQKCPEKYSPAAFEDHWNKALVNKGGGLSLGSLHYWAKMDNPDRYEEVRSRSIHTVVYKKVYDMQLEGNLQHYDIAQILFKSLKHKYVYDSNLWYEFIIEGDPLREGELYKWREQNKAPFSIKRYMSEVLPGLFKKVFDKIDVAIEEKKGDSLATYHVLVRRNFKLSCRKLRDAGFKTGVGHECEQLFERIGFADELDKNPNILGVGNGILVLGEDITFVTGYHNYLVSAYTPVMYKPFNPRDEITKKLLISLRNLFPDDEPDTFNFLMHYLSSALDGRKKESLLLLLVGNGSNGKSFLVELFKSVIGDKYAVKMPMSFLTSRQKNSESATPALMMLMKARMAYYSETDKSEVLHGPKIKEITGQETIGGRKNFGDYQNFKPTCHHLVTSNYDFEVTSTDHGTWRRLKKVPMKIKFCKKNVDHYDEKNPYERIADPSMGSTWPDNKEVLSAFMGILCHYYESLRRNYDGIVENVPHPHIKEETERFRNRQDKINNFINIRIVKTVDEDLEVPMSEVLEKYSRWYNSLYPDDKDYKKSLTLQFENSKLTKIIIKNKLGSFIKGYRVLDNNETPDEGEEYFIDLFMDKKTEKTHKIKSETSDEFYRRICRDFDGIAAAKLAKRKEEAAKERKNNAAKPAAKGTAKPAAKPAVKPEPEKKYDNSGFEIREEQKETDADSDFGDLASDRSSYSDVSYDSSDSE